MARQRPSGASECVGDSGMLVAASSGGGPCGPHCRNTQAIFQQGLTNSYVFFFSSKTDVWIMSVIII